MAVRLNARSREILEAVRGLGYSFDEVRAVLHADVARQELFEADADTIPPEDSTLYAFMVRVTDFREAIDCLEEY